MIRFFTFRFKGEAMAYCKIKGTPEDLMAETCAMIRTIYEQIEKQAPDDAEAYKTAISVAILDSKSPIWEVEHHD